MLEVQLQTECVSFQSAAQRFSSTTTIRSRFLSRVVHKRTLQYDAIEAHTQDKNLVTVNRETTRHQVLNPMQLILPGLFLLFPRTTPTHLASFSSLS